jgi:DNA-binding IclR family transcriptional regulator
MKNENADHKGVHVQSIERTLDILEVLSTEREGLGVTSIAARVGLHKSTAHRLLTTLTERGYVEKNAEGIYRLGLKLIEVVSIYINSLELQTEARPYVARITADLGLTAHLGVLEGDRVVYIERMDVYSGIKLYSQIGIRVHAYCSSLGKCLLSNFSKEELNRTLAECSFNKFTPNTISSIEEMHAEIKKVRKQGWAMDNQEFDMNNRCVGAPIYDYRGEIIAAISASGPPTLLTMERVPGVAEYVMGKAAAISRNLGYMG